MDTLSKVGLWFGRVLLFYVAVLFIYIGSRGLLDPVNASKELGILFASASGITVGRGALGGFPIATAIVVLWCLFSNKRLFYGLAFFAIVIAVLTIIRVYGLAVDGMTAWNVKILKPEIVLTVLSVAAIFFEVRRLKRKITV
jgi:hypothetical protein